MHLVLADDEPAILDVLAAACTADGHDVATFSSSLEALAHIGSHPTDILITDIVMPPPDGFRLVSAARKLQPELVAILVTGYSTRYSLEEVLACGATDLLFKPFRLQELRARVRLAEERRRLMGDLRQYRHPAPSEASGVLRREADELRGAPHRIPPASDPGPNLAGRPPRPGPCPCSRIFPYHAIRALPSPPEGSSMKRYLSARFTVAALLVLATSALLRRAVGSARDPKQPIDEEYTKKIQEYTDRAVLPLAARRLPAGVEDRADAEGGARRHRRRSRQAAVRRGGLPVHAHAREGEPAREGVLDREDGGRARDDRRRRLV